jgi:hypothetical protein
MAVVRYVEMGKLNFHALSGMWNGGSTLRSTHTQTVALQALRQNI